MVQRLRSGFLRWGVVGLVGCMAALSHATSLPVPTPVLTIGAGSLGGVSYAVGGALCRMLKRASTATSYMCNVEATGGPVFNVNALKAAALDFAVVPSDITYNAYRGESQFAAVAAYEPLRAVFSLYPETLTVVARKELAAKSFDDLQGARVNVGHPASATRASVDQLLQTMGTDYGFFSRATELRPDELSEALCSGRIDAFVLTVSHPEPVIQDATALCGAQLVPLSNAVIHTITDRSKVYAQAEIPAALYAHNPDSVPTYGVLSTVVTRDDVDEQHVYDMVKAIFSNLDNFKRLHPVLEHLSAQSMRQDGLSMPLHPGAARYYRERGWLPH